MLSNIFSGDNKQKELHTPVLKLRGKTLIFGRTIYYIPNLSAVEIGQIARPFPIIALILGLVGLVMLASRGSEIIGIIILGVSAFWIYTHFNSARHGLNLVTNSGVSTILISKDVEFLERVALVLYNIMNSEDMTQNYNFNFDQRKIMNVETMENSTAIFGDNLGSVNAHPVS